MLALIGCATTSKPPQLPTALTAPATTILVGDLHGTREIPAFVGDLATQLAADHPVVVALEILASETPSFDNAAWLGDPWWRADYQDGRRSEAMAALIRRLRDAHIPIARFDSQVEARDRAMADNVLAVRAAHPDATLVVYAGNMHTRRNGHPALPGETFMAGYLRRAGLHFVALDTRYETGSSWNCTTSDIASCHAYPAHGAPSARGLHMEPTPDGNYDGWYGVGAISASPPASRQ